MKIIFALVITFLLHSELLFSQVKSLDPIPLDDAWKSKITSLAPEKAQAPISKKHKILLFSLFTGFDHWTIPHVDHVITTLGAKSGAYEVVKSVDIAMFEKQNLKKFDAIVLNNNCSVGPKRDLFFDALNINENLSEDQKQKKASELESNLLQFVKNGGGLAVLHGGIVMQNNAMEVSEMVGGSFDYHPPQQSIELKLVEDNHPISAAFEGQSFTHIDEPYFFKNAYTQKNFKPLLYMEISKIKKLNHETDEKISYVSWIKSYGKGKVFYCSPSHNAQSYEDARLLKFYLNGMQYVLGDLKCDDSPIQP